MPVHDDSYRAWEGEARATHGVILAIAGTMIRRLFRLRLVRYTVIMFPLGASLLASFVFSMVYEGKGHFPLAAAMRRVGFDTAHVLPLMNRWVHGFIGLFGILLAALVGAPLIAEDRRAHALPLYFSRPLTHVDYVLGKFATLAFYLGLLYLLPPLSLYLLDVGYSDADGAAGRQLPVLLRSLVPAAAAVVTLSAVAIGVSSISRRTNYAAVLYFGVMILALVMAKFLSLEVFEDPDWQALSPWLSTRRVAIEMLPLPPQLGRGEEALVGAMDVSAAWTSLALWTGAGFAVLIARVRRVEVVT